MRACRIYAAAVAGVMVAAALTAPGPASAQENVRVSSRTTVTGNGVATSSSSATAGSSNSRNSGRATANGAAGRGRGRAGRFGSGGMQSSVSCTATSRAGSFDDMSDAHVDAVADVFTEFCRTDFDGRIDTAAQILTDSGFAIAQAIAQSETTCVSQGNAVGCASASASAMAWAEATAEAHSMAVARSAERCDCLVGAGSLSLSSASSFIDLVVEAFALAEAQACVRGNDVASASAYANCSAAGYATVFATVRPLSLPPPRAHASTHVHIPSRSPHMLTNACVRTHGATCIQAGRVSALTVRTRTTPAEALRFHHNATTMALGVDTIVPVYCHASILSCQCTYCRLDGQAVGARVGDRGGAAGGRLLLRQRRNPHRGGDPRHV